jgi:hypothetical protein
MRWLGVGRLAGRRLRDEVLASGAVGAIVMGDCSAASFVEAGRVMQRTWLRAAALGLAFAPITVAAVLPLSRRFGGRFKPRSHRLLDRAEAIVHEVFDVESGFVPFLFRLGVAPHAPAVESERRPLSTFVVRES